jgi:hypothetical protein
MRKQNYCQDSCPYNRIERSSFDELQEDGKVKQFAFATTGRNKALNCEIGYKQAAASRDALKNSEKNGTKICPRLHKVL